ncbi:MAG: alpha-L-arabinofuranosidase C-terminal domain-containing protein [Planctomycetaceae bacterium]
MKLIHRLTIISLLACPAALCGQDPPKDPGTNSPRLVVRNRVLHEVDSRLFGQYLERPNVGGEIGREAGVLPGTNRLQPKVLELLRGLNAPIIRFPHGTACDWPDMIDNVPGHGPGRPATVARTGERVANRFGYDEFIRLCEEFEIEPLLPLNFGDGLLGKKPLAEAAQHAAGLVAYCNARENANLPADLEKWPKLRARNGHKEPYRVPYVQIGGEMFSHVRGLKERHPTDYVQRYVVSLKAYVLAIKAVDPAVQIITDSHGPEVDMAVRRELGNRISFLVEHYYTPREFTQFTRSGKPVPTSEISTRQLWNAYVAVGPVDAKTGLSILPPRPVVGAKSHGYPLALTEWNWNGWWAGAPSAAPVELPLARAVGAAGMLHGLMRAGHVVKIACQSNAIGNAWGISAIRADPAGKVDPYYLPTGQVVALYAGHHGDTLLETVSTNVPTFEQPLEFGVDGVSMMLGGHASPKVAALDALATGSPKAIYLHLINRDFDGSLDLEVDLAEFRNLTGAGTRFSLTGRLRNEPGPGETRQVAHLHESAVRLEGAVLRIKLAPRTVSCVELEKRGEATTKEPPKAKSRPADAFRAKSVWIGDSPKQTLTVLERHGDTFRASFTSEVFDREVTGTIKNGELSWLAKDVRALKGRAGGDNYGTINGDTIDFMWRDGNGGSGSFSLRLKKTP